MNGQAGGARTRVGEEERRGGPGVTATHEGGGRGALGEKSHITHLKARAEKFRLKNTQEGSQLKETHKMGVGRRPISASHYSAREVVFTGRRDT